MSDYFVIAEYESLEQVAIALEVLEKSGYTTEQVSVISGADGKDVMDQIEVSEEQKKSSAGASAGLGMLLGGSLAAPIAMGTMIGPLMIAGPLVGLAAGAGLGGLLGSATEKTWEEKVADYEQRVRDGSYLVVVTAEDRIELDDAANPLKTTGPLSLERFEPPK